MVDARSVFTTLLQIPRSYLVFLSLYSRSSAEYKKATTILTISKHDLERVCIHLASRRSAPARNHRFPMSLRYVALRFASDTFVVPGIVRRNVSKGLFDGLCFGNS